MNEDVFLKTQDTTAHPELIQPGGIYERITVEFLINWPAATWVDLRRPLFSALAARIFFMLASAEIPDIGNVRAQGDFWKDTEFNVDDEDTVDDFVESVTALELEGKECN